MGGLFRWVIFDGWVGLGKVDWVSNRVDGWVRHWMSERVNHWEVRFVSGCGVVIDSAVVKPCG